MLIEPGIYEYALPKHDKIELVSFVRSGGIARSFVLSEIPFPELMRLRAHDVKTYGVVSLGFPVCYAVRDDRELLLYPVPAQHEELKVTLIKRTVI